MPLQKHDLDDAR